MNNLLFEKIYPSGRFQVKSKIPFVKDSKKQFIVVNQIHGNIINDCSYLSTIPKEISSADGICANYTQNSMIKTADCLPILVLGKKSYLLIHAGWKGLYNNILKNPFIKKIEPYLFFIGPSICPKCFEVQPDFKKYFKNDKYYSTLQSLSSSKQTKINFNLWQLATDQIDQSFPNIEIENANQCTYHNSQYFSFRRDKTEKRNYNIFITNEQ